jgi:hypothetical protein
MYPLIGKQHGEIKRERELSRRVSEYVFGEEKLDEEELLLLGSEGRQEERLKSAELDG